MDSFNKTRSLYIKVHELRIGLCKETYILPLKAQVLTDSARSGDEH